MGKQKQLYLTAAIILIVGLSSAVIIYLTAEMPSDISLIRDFENSKRYVHNLELYGGKMNVIADQFWRWVEGLWRGERLAFTVACITACIASGFFLVAHQTYPDSVSRPGDE